MHILLAAILAVFSLCSAARAQNASDQDLRDLMDWVHLQAPEARLAKLYSIIDSDGNARCWPKGGRYYDGWEMIFQGASYQQWMVMGCRPRRLTTAYLSPFPIVEKPFLGIDAALRLLRANKLIAEGAPIRATLSAPAEAGRDAAWKFETGAQTIQVDAYTGTLLSGAPTAANAASPAQAGPVEQKRRKVHPKNSAREHIDRVFQFARQRLPDYELMAIDALTDAQGSVFCTPPSDGWAFYFYRTKQPGRMNQLETIKNTPIQVVYDCRGDVDFGKTSTPFDAKKNAALPKHFIDSSTAMSAVPANIGNVVTMRLLRYKNPPFPGHPLLWQIGKREWHWVDAVNGKYLGKTP